MPTMKLSPIPAVTRVNKVISNNCVLMSQIDDWSMIKTLIYVIFRRFSSFVFEERRES